MDITVRQQDILLAARTQGRVEVEALAESLDVTSQTIRRDLNELCRQGLLTRIHGGAMLANRVANVSFAERRNLASDAKDRIARVASALIPDNCSLIINLGTTTEKVARALHERTGLVVITNNINVINILTGSPDKELILAGGVVRQSDGGIVGETAVEFFKQFKVDYAVIGTSAIDEDGAILDYDQREVSVARAILDSSRHVILVADHRKFSRTAPMRISSLDRIDTIVTDKAPSKRFLRACRQSGVKVEIAEPDEISSRNTEDAARANPAHV